jgi:hypothetical protein
MRLVFSWLGGGPAQRPLTTLLAREQIVSSNNDQRLRHRAPYRGASAAASTTRCTTAHDLAPTLQAALDRWDDVEPRLRARAEQLEQGAVSSTAFDATRVMAPLPRAYE